MYQDALFCGAIGTPSAEYRSLFAGLMFAIGYRLFFELKRTSETAVGGRDEPVCGIVGIVDYEGVYSTDALRRLTTSMRDDLAHRGPDDAGLWTSRDGRVCFGQRRLSVIDLRPEGRQPMANEDGSVVVTFNGEIYNFRALREDLERRGHTFRSETDTEVLCHLLEDDADEAVPQLEGMFAFAAWRTSSRLYLFVRGGSFLVHSTRRS